MAKFFLISLDLTPFVGAGLAYFFYHRWRGRARRAAEARHDTDQLMK